MHWLFLQRDYGQSVELVQLPHCRWRTKPRGQPPVVVGDQGLVVASDAGGVCIGTTRTVPHARTTSPGSNALRGTRSHVFRAGVAVWRDRTATSNDYGSTSTGSNNLSDGAVRDYTGSAGRAVLAVGRWAAAAV